MIDKKYKIGVAGAGVMGSGIAQVMALSGCAVVCRDINEEILTAAAISVDSGRFGVKSAVERGKLTDEEANNALARLHFTTDLNNLNDSDLIIEAIPERFDLKVSFWKELDKTTSDRPIFASNSSGFPISALADATEMVKIACTTAKNKQLVSPDDKVIITAGVPFGNAGSTNLLRIAKIISKQNLT